MNVKDSPLYKSLCKSVRKQDHAELLRMLEMVPASSWNRFPRKKLIESFMWDSSPQGYSYWAELYKRMCDAGFDQQ